MGDNGPSADAIKSTLLKFFTEKVMPLSRVETFKDDDSFIESGILDSTGVLELLQYIEEKFTFRVADDEIVPENLDSLNKLAAFIARKTAGPSS